LRHTAGDDASKPCGAEPGKTPTIDGERSESIGIRPGERQLWRVLNASGERHFDLHVPGVRFQLVAQDGVPLAEYPGGVASRTVDDIVIPPAGRAEFVVIGPSAPAALISECYDAGPSGDPNPRITLGRLYDDRGATPAAIVAPPMGLKTRTAYRTVLPRPSATRVVRLQETDATYFINGVAYEPAAAPMFRVKTGTTERWIVENDTDEVHSFHTHQVHFIVEATNGARNNTPNWIDTVDVPPQRRTAHGVPRPSTITILVDFRNPVIAGTFLFHCHLTDHEDGGMAAKVLAQ
jgi:FtsP/CotA-like multicopper oxidase with cupredoxin domain